MGLETQSPGAPTLEANPEESEMSDPTEARSRRRLSPALALAAIVGSAFVVYTLLASLVDVPRVHPDEVRYLIAGSSLVEGEGLTLRGGEYGFGPLYAFVLAAILSVTPGVDVAYELFKGANALFFALVAVPVYLLARRLVPQWWAVVAAGLSVAIPSSISIATVMTESLAYLTSAWAMLAIARALERPSVGRQLAMLAAIGLAYLTRPMLGVLYVAWIVALVVVWWITPASRPRTRADLVRLWPSALPAVLAVLVLVGRVLSGTSPSESLGAYWELWRGYDPLGVVKWFVYHLGDFELYLVVVPMAVLPIVLASLVRRGRAGSAAAATFAALFVSANAALLLLVAAFNTTPYAYDRLHDRYAFYLLPLWLIAFVVWLADGMPRPLLATGIGAALALLLPAILPFRQLANVGIDTVPGGLWIWLENETSGSELVSARRLLALFVVGLVAAAIFLPRRFKLALPVAVAVMFAVMSIFAWERMIDAPEDEVFAGSLTQAWIDDVLPRDASVTKLYVESAACPASRLTRHALFLTEFFNMTVDRAAYIGDSIPDGIPLPRAELDGTGRLVTSPGEPLLADYVYTQPGLELAGSRLATGTAANLVLWKTGGEVRVRGAETTADIRTAECS